MNKEQIQAAVNPMPQFQVLQNGSVNQAVNFAVEDFYKAALVLKRATNNFETPHVNLPPGVQSFVQQQFFRMNAAGLLLDALGYQGVTQVLAVMHPAAVGYIEATMAAWNKVINEEGEVEKIWKALEAEEKAQANPPAGMQ